MYDLSPKEALTQPGTPSSPSGLAAPTRQGLLPPSRLVGHRGHQAASGSHSVRSPASPRLPYSLKGFCPSPPTSTDHERKTEPNSDGLEERRTEAGQRRAEAPRTLRLRHVARKGPADAIWKRPCPASQSSGRMGSQSTTGEGGPSPLNQWRNLLGDSPLGNQAAAVCKTDPPELNPYSLRALDLTPPWAKKSSKYLLFHVRRLGLLVKDLLSHRSGWEGLDLSLREVCSDLNTLPVTGTNSGIESRFPKASSLPDLAWLPNSEAVPGICLCSGEWCSPHGSPGFLRPKP